MQNVSSRKVLHDVASLLHIQELLCGTYSRDVGNVGTVGIAPVVSSLPLISWQDPHHHFRGPIIEGVIDDMSYRGKMISNICRRKPESYIVGVPYCPGTWR